MYITPINFELIGGMIFMPIIGTVLFAVLIIGGQLTLAIIIDDQGLYGLAVGIYIHYILYIYIYIHTYILIYIHILFYTYLYSSILVYIYIYIYMCVCVCVCVRLCLLLLNIQCVPFLCEKWKKLSASLVFRY